MVHIRLALPSSPAEPDMQSPRKRKFRRPPLLSIIIAFTILLYLSISVSRSNEYELDTLVTESADHWVEWGEGRVTGLTAKLGKGAKTYKEIMGLDECAKWNPLSPEVDDPAGCLRARQYRQVQRVLRREEKGAHGHWGFATKTNIATLQKLSRCFLPIGHDSYTPCVDRPVIVNGYWWSALTILNGTSGESIWQESVLKQFETHGMMTLFVGDYTNWITTAEMMPDVYRFIWAPEVEVVSCFTDPRCIAANHYVPPHGAEDLSLSVPDNERGVIPIWRLQIVDYWGSQPKEISNNDHYWGLTEHGEWSYHSLGTEWIQVPWPMPGHVFLPYSIEDLCLQLPVKPHAERDDSVLIFAKRSSYFHMSNYVTPINFLSDLSRQPHFDLLSTAKLEEGKLMPHGLETLGVQSRESYEALVGSTKVLLGIGFPPISPSVYSALCQGTPIVLPYRTNTFNASALQDGWGVYSGHYQHGPAMAIGPPYVYSYQKDNYTQLLESVNTALTTPIERFIPEYMKLPYALAQSKAFLDRDLHSMFRAVLRKNGGKVPRLKAGTRERCAELKRCQLPLPEGRRPSTPALAKEMEKLDEVEKRRV